MGSNNTSDPWENYRSILNEVLNQLLIYAPPPYFGTLFRFGGEEGAAFPLPKKINTVKNNIFVFRA